MPGLDKNRFRNKTISFRMSPEERRKLEAKITVSGLSKGDYFRKMLLDGEIIIRVGKYESDRLSLEIKNLRNRLNEYMLIKNELETKELLKDCLALIYTLNETMSRKESYHEK